MFTGIVEEIGTVRQVVRGTRSSHFVIAADKVLNNTKIGDSICTSGAVFNRNQHGQRLL